MASTPLSLSVLSSGRVRSAGRLVLAAALGGTALLSFVPETWAGFEWSPPVRTAPASPTVGGVSPAPLTSSDLNAGPVPRPSVAPVMAQPLAPLPDGSAETVSSVPPIDLQPLKPGAVSRRDRLAGLQSAQGSTLSVSSSSAAVDFAPPAVLAERRAQTSSAASPAPVPPPSRFAEAAGFGRDMPLALAMRQVIPPSYGFSFADGVDAGQRVSWAGGKPWDQVLDAALRPAGLGASISGNAVHIAPLPMGGVRAPVTSAGPQAVPASPISARPEAAPRREALTPLPMAAPAPQRRVMKGVDAELLPDPVSAPQVSTGAPVPLTGSVPPSGFPKGLIKASGPLDLPPVSPEPMPSDKDLAPIPGEASLPRSPVAFRDPAMESAQPRVTPVSFPAKAPGLSARGFDMHAVQDWSAPAGATLRRVLTDWSEQAGVQLHWSSQFDYPIQANIRMTGTYQKAVETLLDGLRDAKPRPLARLHPNLPAGPAVLILQTQHVIN